MKFDKDANKVFKFTKNYLADIEDNIVNFKNFCKEIVEGNYPSFESQCYHQFYRDADTMINMIHNNIKDMLFKLQQKYDDKERASVLYPYEKQAIWEYLRKWDDKHNILKMFGCIYAEKVIINNKPYVTIGISVCNDQDIFSKNIAIALAKKRAREYPNKYNIRVNSESKDNRIPSKLFYEYAISKFMTRCNKWFKDENIFYPNNINFIIFSDKKKKSDKIINEPMPF